MYGAVAFDLDDTLAVTRRDRETLLRAAAEAAGVPLSFDREDYLAAHREHSGSETRRPVFEALLSDPDEAAALTRAYNEAILEAIEPVDGAGSLLERLAARRRLGLLTDGPERTQRDKLRRLGRLRPHADARVRRERRRGEGRATRRPRGRRDPG